MSYPPSIEIDSIVRRELRVKPGESINDRASKILRRRSRLFGKSFNDARTRAARIILSDGPPWQRMYEAAAVFAN